MTNTSTRQSSDRSSFFPTCARTSTRNVSKDSVIVSARLPVWGSRKQSIIATLAAIPRISDIQKCPTALLESPVAPSPRKRTCSVNNSTVDAPSLTPVLASVWPQVLLDFSFCADEPITALSHLRSSVALSLLSSAGAQLRFVSIWSMTSAPTASESSPLMAVHSQSRALVEAMNPTKIVILCRSSLPLFSANRALAFLTAASSEPLHCQPVIDLDIWNWPPRERTKSIRQLSRGVVRDRGRTYRCLVENTSLWNHRRLPRLRPS